MDRLQFISSLVMAASPVVSVVIALLVSNRAVSRLEIVVDHLDGRINQLGGRIDQLGGRIDHLGVRIDSTNHRIDELTKSVNSFHLQMSTEISAVRERVSVLENRAQ